MQRQTKQKGSASALRRREGFTLIELLVVIAIIALLASVALVALNASRQKARNAKRVADMNQFAKALELYFNNNFTYPTLAASGALSGLVGSPPVVSDTIINKLPVTISPADGTCGTGPGNGTNDYYFYANNSAGTASTYAITFCLGSQTGSLVAGPHTLTQAGFQ